MDNIPRSPKEAMQELKMDILNWIFRLMNAYDFGDNPARRDEVVQKLARVEPEKLYACFLSIMNALGVGANEKEEAKSLLSSLHRMYEGAEKNIEAGRGTVLLQLQTNLRFFLRGLDQEAVDILKKIESAIQSLSFDEVVVLTFAMAYALGFAGIGSSSLAKPTLLRRLLKPRNPSLRKLQGSNLSGFAKAPEKM